MNITVPVKFQRDSDLDANFMNHKFREFSELIYTSDLDNEFCIPYIFLNNTEFNPAELYANFDAVIKSFINILSTKE